MSERVHVKMLQTKPGADDGVTVRTYEKGQTYEVGPDLAAAFLRNEWAKQVDAPAPADSAEDDPALAKLSKAELEERCQEAGIDLGDIEGTGKGGSVVKADLIAALQEADEAGNDD